MDKSVLKWPCRSGRRYHDNRSDRLLLSIAPAISWLKSQKGKRDWSLELVISRWLLLRPLRLRQLSLPRVALPMMLPEILWKDCSRLRDFRTCCLEGSHTMRAYKGKEKTNHCRGNTAVCKSMFCTSAHNLQLWKRNQIIHLQFSWILTSFVWAVVVSEPRDWTFSQRSWCPSTSYWTILIVFRLLSSNITMSYLRR